MKEQPAASAELKAGEKMKNLTYAELVNYDLPQARALFDVHGTIGQASHDVSCFVKPNHKEKIDAHNELSRYARFRNDGGFEPAVVVDGTTIEGDVLFLDLVDFYEYTYGERYSGRTLSFRAKPWIGMDAKTLSPKAIEKRLNSR